MNVKIFLLALLVIIVLFILIALFACCKVASKCDRWEESYYERKSKDAIKK